MVNDTGELGVLRHLMALSLGTRRIEVPELEPFDGVAERSARCSYFLLYRSPGADDGHHHPDTRFGLTTLAVLLRKLTSRTERQLNEYQGRVRGRVHWPATLKSRYSGDYDPTRFVCRETRVVHLGDGLVFCKELGQGECSVVLPANAQSQRLDSAMQ